MRPLLRFAIVPLLLSSRAVADPVYPWNPTAPDALETRFAAPSGFHRTDVAAGSFAAFLRRLPLLPPNAPVVDYKGTPLYDGGHHPNIAAVADLDVGRGDLQQCADTVIRLHAEWRYGLGARDITYRSVAGKTMAYGSLVAERRRDDHRLFRSYLDEVFTWANTASLERDGAKVAWPDVRAGDFFVMAGNPFGHAVLVLDVAKDDQGNFALLLGQGYMPAQSFQILRESESQAWFVVPREATQVKTPFWKAFPVTSLRRL